MYEFFRYMAKLHLGYWIAGLFIFHAVLYMILGTHNWLGVTLIATGTWAVALLILKAVGRVMSKGKAS